MERQEFAEVFYGTGPVPPPWATDCPVKFEVWWAYARANPDERLDLILALGEHHVIANVFDHVQNFAISDRSTAGRRPVLSGTFIAVELDFDELVALILPMTGLGRKVGTARNAVASQSLAAEAFMELIIRGDEFAVPGSAEADAAQTSAWETAQIGYRGIERREHLRWCVRMTDAVIRGQVPDLSAAARAAMVWSKLGLVGPTQIRLPTLHLGAPSIDRRARHPVTSVTLNRRAVPAVSESRATVKADAAEQVFGIDCSEIGWAVVDSGIDALHPAFALPPEPGGDPMDLSTRVVETYDLTEARDGISPDTYGAEIDWAAVIRHIAIPHRSDTYRSPKDPHGTHVAGVLGADWNDPPSTTLRGVAPTIRLYDFRVMGPQGGDEFAVIAALQLIRFLNEQSGSRVIHGVNISLSLRHDVANFSCGWTPICEECDRLVRSGVVVVAAAGNSGFEGGDFATGYGYNTVSITDPGNADAVITVGSTHRTHPHRHGVSYFSSRGPTADGRHKPDLLAPGEDIDGPVPGGGLQAMHGTSQAAAHVSGVAAMLMARYRELRGRPERVKQILCATATDLGREPWFQGAGLLDALRAMQSI